MLEVLKQAICNYYQRNFNVELDYQNEALITIGAKEGIASLATAIADKDNYICVPSPSYPIHTFAFIIAKSMSNNNGSPVLRKFICRLLN